MRSRWAHRLVLSHYGLLFIDKFSSEKATKVLTEEVIVSHSDVSGGLEGLLYEFGGLLLVELGHMRARDFFIAEVEFIQVLRSFNLFKLP